MHQYGIFVFIISIAAFFSYVNHRYLKLPATIGIVLQSIVFAILLNVTSGIFPAFSQPLVNMFTQLDFHSLLMDCMLGFLLFAGSIHIDASVLKRESIPIIILATVGVFISTFLIGTLMYWLFGFMHYPVDYIYCLLFAALISPTDPIAVLAILKQAGLPKSLEMKIAGESLFNDGVAVVVFITILEVAQIGTDKLVPSDVVLLFAREAVGGLLFGLVLGYVGYRAIKSIDKYEVEVLITIATVMGGYYLANALHTSGPLAMVAAGILIGNKSRAGGVSDITRDYLDKFWELIDEILNAILFMLVGFEMLVIKFHPVLFSIGLVTILIVLASRWVAVAVPVTIIRYKVKLEKNAIAILTWGGLRGGLSIALALSLPEKMQKEEFVFITYMVVIFSIIVQGLTIGKLYRRLEQKDKAKNQ